MSLSDNILNEIENLRRVSGTLEKERILRRNQTSPAFTRILQYTYNPFVKYHIRKIPNEVRGAGYGELNQETWILLNKLSLRKITGNVARETLFEYMVNLSPSAATILRLIIRKDLKAGIATKTINKIIPGLIPTFDCQLVENWVESKTNYPLLVGPKIDGTRGEKRGGSIYTRRGHRITGVQHIIDYLSTVSSDMTASGELWIPGMPFRRSDGIMRSNKEEKTNARYALFDVPSMGSLPLEERLKYLSRTFYPLESNPLPPVCHIPHLLVANLAEVDKLYNYWRSRGYEGLVGKDPTSLSRMGKSHDWMRKVNTISAEYKIAGVYESEERPGYMGGIIIEGDKGSIKVGSGFVDSEREEYLRNPGLIIGKFATIEAKEKTAAGSLRQPIYKAIRWDI